MTPGLQQWYQKNSIGIEYTRPIPEDIRGNAEVSRFFSDDKKSRVKMLIIKKTGVRGRRNKYKAERDDLLRLVKHWKAEAKRYQELYYDIEKEDK